MSTFEDSIKTVAKGAVVYFLGTILGMFLAVIAKIIVVRVLTPAQFGILTLALTIITIASRVGNLGLPDSITRQASYFIGKGDKFKAETIMTAGLIFSVLSGFTTMLLIHLSSDEIAHIFGVAELSYMIKILSLSIPFIILTTCIISIFRTHNMTSLKVMFSDLIPNVLRLIIVIFIINTIVGSYLYPIAWAYTIPYIVTGISCIVVLFRNKKIKFRFSGLLECSIILLSFSIPILFQSILGLVMNWTDVLLIGYYLTAKEVGLYNSASVLARLMVNVLVAVNFLYLPVISSLYASSKIDEIRRMYYVVTKWIASVALPYFLLLFLFPNAVLQIIYGDNYVHADLVLRFLALAFFTHIIFGPNGITLISLGNAKFVMLTILIGSILNLILNIILIPSYGINGASFASMITYIIINIILLIKLYNCFNIHPFTKNYIKPLATSIFIAHILFFYSSVKIINIFYLIALFMLFALLHFLSITLTRSFDNEDIKILLEFERKLNLDLKLIKNIIRRFI